MLNPAQDGLCPAKPMSGPVASNIGETESLFYERTRKSTTRLLNLLREHHGYSVPKPAFTKAPQIIEIKAADPELAERVEICVLPIPAPKLTVDGIKRVVCKHFSVSHAEMISPRRDRKVGLPRMVAVYLVKEFTSKSLPEIGRRFGGRDHTTMIRSIRKVEGFMASNNPIAKDVKYLREVLSS